MSNNNDDNNVTAESIIKEKTGIELNFTQTLADSIVSQYMTTIGEDVLKNTFEAMNRKYLDTKYDYSKSEDIQTLKLDEKDRWGNYPDNSITRQIDKLIAKEYGDAILENVREYMKTDEFKVRLKNMTDEVVNYALEGYKEDMITRLRERLVGNAYASVIYENGAAIDQKITDAVQETMYMHEINDHHKNPY